MRVALVIFIVYLLLFTACRARAVEMVPMVTVNAFFEQAALASGTLRNGEEQELHLILHNGGGSETIFQLTVTYANGVEQSIVKATTAGEATLVWIIPPDAGVGHATFHLTTTGCGCGVRNVAQVNTVFEGSAEGEFYVQ